VAPVVAGIDVGGDRKGCNLVVLQGTTVLCSIAGAAPEALLAPCLAHGVVAVGIDAPCVWRIGAHAPQAEREMARAGIHAFSTPARDIALASTSGFYGWMFNGERVYQALSAVYPVLTAPAYAGGRISFETFPHAITASFLGRATASARLKNVQRREILEGAGIDTSALTSIDAIDAALCALAARHLVAGTTHPFGAAADGYIHVPHLGSATPSMP
jgi:predicted nuclease with RNAse H fold